MLTAMSGSRVYMAGLRQSKRTLLISEEGKMEDDEKDLSGLLSED